MCVAFFTTAQASVFTNTAAKKPRQLSTGTTGAVLCRGQGWADNDETRVSSALGPQLAAWPWTRPSAPFTSVQQNPGRQLGCNLSSWVWEEAGKLSDGCYSASSETAILHGRRSYLGVCAARPQTTANADGTLGLWLHPLFHAVLTQSCEQSTTVMPTS